jgi:hypothetical protein
VAGKARKKNGQATKRPKLTYFFLNGELHRKLGVNRGKDQLKAWNYTRRELSTYPYTDALRRYEKAFTTTEVCKMVNRGKQTVELAILRGMIERPQSTYALEGKGQMFQYMWSEKDILELLDYLSTVHRGRPRADGDIRPQHLPTPREIRAMIHEEGVTLYIKQGDTFIPSWKAKEWE